MLENVFSYSPQQLVYTVFLPFIMVFAIIFGVLQAIRLFNKKINVVLALAITFLAAYGGLFDFFSTYFLYLGPYFGVAVFVAVFVVGALAWGIGRGKEFYYQSLSPEKKLEEINKKIEKEYERYRNESDPAKKRAIDRKIVELEREREHIIREIEARKW